MLSSRVFKTSLIGVKIDSLNKEERMAEIEVGRVTGYFAHVGVAGIDLTASLKVGEKIHIKGHTTDLEQLVESMQIDNESVQEAAAGAKIGVKVSDRCRNGDQVFRIKD